MAMDGGFDSAGRGSGGWHDAGPAASDPPPSPGPETHARDPRDLAQDWITLWQSELSALAADPEMRESWQTVMTLWAGAMTQMLRAMPRGAPGTSGYDHPGFEPPRGPSGPADAPRPAPAAAAPDARDAEIDRLARHVAILERRLADLERGGDPPVDPKRRPGRKSRR